MKAVAFADLHGNMRELDRIIRASKKAELLLCAGDLTNFQRGLVGMLRKLERTGKRVVIIPGNHESPRYLKEFSRRFPHIKEIHKSSCIIGNLLIIGYGSGGFLQREPDFPSTAKKFSEIIKKHPEKKVVMLSHAPP
ncbi:MAG: metallophosphoesterase, partial [Candidatus Woesearchaeota archaeon]|nr:metallophosphoesterase [Candidatus Woesearchaeota archaeon]